ncbi:MAG TPA: MBL fold metallo-hydrolase [Chloroflexota bacterium]|nr:MBL fold metallo-hydrolase [Chloroflexota bacterium]
MEARRGHMTPLHIRLGADRDPVDLVQGSMTFIGAGTVLLRYGGFTILTDPSFLPKGEEAPLGYGLRSRRLTHPSLQVDDLPPIDLVVLSHYHGDHFDPAAQEQLDRLMPIITTPHAAGILEQNGFWAACGLSTWNTVAFDKGDTQLRITALPGNHRPGPLSRLFPPVMGTLLEFRSPADTQRFTVYISGDTLMCDELLDIPERVPVIDLALLHLGGTRIMGMLLTMDGKEGVELMKLLSPRLTIPIHFHDYSVYRSPLSDFQRRVEEAGLGSKVQYVSHGETVSLHIEPALMAPSRERRQRRERYRAA